MSRPTVTLKLATSLDGRIAAASGESRWITGPAAREKVHRLRAAHQAVLIGSATALADDPDLTVRLPDWTGPQPARVVLDSRQRLDVGARLVRTAREIPTFVVSIVPPRSDLVAAGVEVLTVAARDGRVDPAAALAALGERLGPSARVLAEGGGQVAASLLAAGLVDRLEWFRAPRVLGAAGRPAVGELPTTGLDGAPRLRRLAVEAVGDDLWERYDVLR